MKLRYYIIALLSTLVMGVFVILFMLPAAAQKMDTVIINDMAYTLGNEFDQLQDPNYTLPNSDDLNYSVIDNDGNLLAGTGDTYAHNINDAMARSNLIVDISNNGFVVGKLLVETDLDQRLQAYLLQMRVFTILIIAVMAGVIILLLSLIYLRIIKPFKDMQNFAMRIAAGDLDIPLDMRKRNVFGSFTESFDLMRDELKTARTREYMAEMSKREMVASLSHDIQSPVASIKAVAELIEATTKDEAQKQKLSTIVEKADQISILSSDLYSSVQEKQQDLSVSPYAYSSKNLYKMILRCDYRALVRLGPIPSCLLSVDPVRLAQVFDNIIGNSYKYAKTEIDVSAKMIDDGLVLSFRDFGPGVDPEELPLLTSKYYRGSVAEGMSGYGLGLFIARSLIERMGGEIECHNSDPGFTVDIWLKFEG